MMAAIDPALYSLHLVFFIFLGLVLGSFATALAYRVARSEPWSLLTGKGARSACPHCQTNLGLPDLIPVFSWLWLRGRCRHCQEVISPRYPLMELVSLAAALLVFAVNGFAVESFIIMAFVPFLLAMAVIDLDRFILPNQLMVICAVLALIYAFWGAWDSGDFTIIALNIAAAFFYGGLAWGIGRLVSTLLRKDALGFGDVKFFAISGLALGFTPLPLYLLLAGTIGVLLGSAWKFIHGQNVFPFGPALIISLYLLLVFT